MSANETAIPPALPTVAITRRGLFRMGAAGSALCATPLAARGFGSGFTHGVASGEPAPDSVLLWTRYFASDPGAIEWVISERADLGNPVAGGSIPINPDSDFCLKVKVTGLAPARWYYYGFIAPDGSRSEIGRTRTLPEGDVERFRMAVFSCSNFGFGYFNAYAHAAEADEFDLALHLGDYIYEYKRDSYPVPEEASLHRELWPVNEVVHLADYRLRYATYRSDPDLRRIHQLLPMINIWDDHETANNSWKDGAENHQSETEGDWEVRKAAARRANREWLPVSDEVYASYEVGNLATLFRLDTRIEGRDEQFDLAKVLAGKKSPEEVAGALKAFREGEYLDPGRQILGAAQEAWLGEELKRSTRAGKRWQVLVQQVVMGKLSTPTSLLDAIGDSAPDFYRRRIAAATTASKAGLPANMDAWDGYPAARDRLLAASLEAEANLLVLAGDSHNSWAFELDYAGAKAGIEFAVQSVTSPGLERYLGAMKPADLAHELVSYNPCLKYTDTSQRGYAVLELTPERATAEYRYLGTVKSRGATLASAKRISSAAMSGNIDIG